jgi:carbamoyltransferase
MTTEPWVLGISASHDGAACLLHGHELVVAIKEERLARVRRKRVLAGDPAACIFYCLQAAGIRIEDVDRVAITVQGKSRADSHDLSRNALLRSIATTKVLHVPHHAAHAVSAFAASGFKDAAVLVVDDTGSPFEDLWPSEKALIGRNAAGSWECLSTYYAEGTTLTPIGKQLYESGEWAAGKPGLPRFRSLGGMYAAAGQQIFGQPLEGGKVMGLAPYGQCRFDPQDFFDVVPDGLRFLDTVPARIAGGERWPHDQSLNRDLARSVQEALEVALLHTARQLRSQSGNPRLCYAGGVALNGVANERILAEAGFDDVFLYPAADDGGCAVGAAYWALWQMTGENVCRRMTADRGGRDYTKAEIIKAADAVGGVRLMPTADPVAEASARLLDGQIIGWFVDRSEFGPRALGQRSIVCDPRGATAKDELNARIKKREDFRPFAPAILQEVAADWFDLACGNDDSPFMMRVSPFKAARRAAVPAVVHVDGSGRLQTVSRGVNGLFYDLIAEFNRRTGVPMVLNTSFNGKDEPIVETPQNALRTTLATGLDACVFSDFVAIPR